MQDCYIHWAIQYGVVVTRMQHLNGGPARKGGGGGLTCEPREGLAG